MFLEYTALLYLDQSVWLWWSRPARRTRRRFPSASIWVLPAWKLNLPKISQGMTKCSVIGRCGMCGDGCAPRAKEERVGIFVVGITYGIFLWETSFSRRIYFSWIFVVEFTKKELLLVWKGLYYCMWMSDKPKVQVRAGSLNVSALTASAWSDRLIDWLIWFVLCCCPHVPMVTGLVDWLIDSWTDWLVLV